MIRIAVKKLLQRKFYVESNLIGEYLRRNYPVQNDINAFNQELNKKLDCAVRVGLIAKQGENAYYLPTLRQEANMIRSVFSAFWEMYKNVIKYLIRILFCTQIFIIYRFRAINRVFHETEVEDALRLKRIQ